MTIITAQWPAPPQVKAITTTRFGGVSQGDFAQWNLAAHVQDNPDHVATNRQILLETLQLPNDPIWLNQTHSTRCVNVDIPGYDSIADASLSRQSNQVLAIMTADCLPIMLCNQQGTEIAAIHAGWRGLAMGIINHTLAQMQTDPRECMAWIGPAICGKCYATGNEVLEQFVARYPYTQQAFNQIEQQWYADLPKIATLILQNLGIQAVYASHLCTFESHSQFYSYRRAAQTGRIGTLIWLQD